VTICHKFKPCALCEISHSRRNWRWSLFSASVRGPTGHPLVLFSLNTGRPNNFSLHYSITCLPWLYRQLGLFRTTYFHRRRISPHQVFMNSQYSHVMLPRTKILSHAMKFMRNVILVSQRTHYIKHITHRQACWTVISVGGARIHTQAIVFIIIIWHLF
jgi:hypothetical protein